MDGEEGKFLKEAQVDNTRQELVRSLKKAGIKIHSEQPVSKADIRNVVWGTCQLMAAGGETKDVTEIFDKFEKLLPHSSTLVPPRRSVHFYPEDIWVVGYFGDVYRGGVGFTKHKLNVCWARPMIQYPHEPS